MCRSSPPGQLGGRSIGEVARAHGCQELGHARFHSCCREPTERHAVKDRQARRAVCPGGRGRCAHCAGVTLVTQRVQVRCRPAARVSAVGVRMPASMFARVLFSAAGVPGNGQLVCADIQRWTAAGAFRGLAPANFRESCYPMIMPSSFLRARLVRHVPRAIHEETRATRPTGHERCQREQRQSRQRRAIEESSQALSTSPRRTRGGYRMANER